LGLGAFIILKKRMSTGYKQSNDELRQHLKDTIEALQLSANAFDNGFEGEAKRCAAAIRVLVHDTRNSNSLLNQLGLKTVKFFDTSVPYNPKTILTHSGITAINLRPEGAVHIAPLDGLPSGHIPKWVSFDEWWEGIIFVDKDKVTTSRKDLVLSIADKDGGAHVDPNLDEKYANLSRLNSLAWRFKNETSDVALEGPEKAAIRQITHEMLKTLNPGMKEIKREVKGTMFMDAIALVEEKPKKVKKISGNAPCPCGAKHPDGKRKKYKHCCGRK
jgi:hypothetical protein